MAFLDRSSLIVDAVLTDKGREKLASNSFDITKFALGDDDVDYSLYDETNTNGPNFYGFVIENMPVLEAFTRSTDALKYQLVTRPVNVNVIPTISESIPETFSLVGEGDYALISPSTLGVANDDEEYIFTLVGNENDIDFMLGDYGDLQSQTAQEYEIVVTEVDAVSGKPLDPVNVLGYTYNGLDSKRQDPLQFDAPVGSSISFIPVQDTRRVLTRVEVLGEGLINHPTSGPVKTMTMEEAIYSPEGFEIITNGSATIRLHIAIQPGGNKAPKTPKNPFQNQGPMNESPLNEAPPKILEPIDNEEKNGGKQTLLVQVSKDKGFLSENKKGDFKELVDNGMKFGNKRFDAVYTSKGKSKTVTLTVKRINPQQNSLELSKKLGKLIPENISLRIEGK